MKLINLSNILAGGKFVCRPYLVNELKTQRILQDRRKVYSVYTYFLMPPKIVICLFGWFALETNIAWGFCDIHIC